VIRAGRRMNAERYSSTRPGRERCELSVGVRAAALSRSSYMPGEGVAFFDFLHRADRSGVLLPVRWSPDPEALNFRFLWRTLVGEELGGRDFGHRSR
jgi:hypothetical protein